MAQALAKIRNDCQSHQYYTRNELQSMLEHSHIWPAGCNIIRAALGQSDDYVICLDRDFARHYAAVGAELGGANIYLRAIPRDCVNMIMNDLHTEQQVLYYRYISHRVTLFGKLNSWRDMPAYIYWKSPHTFTLNWYTLNVHTRARGAHCIKYRKLVTFTYSYNPHDRGEMLKHAVGSYDDCGVTLYHVVCTINEFQAMCAAPLPQTVEAAAHFAWPAS